jgi:hypothetical protein
MENGKWHIRGNYIETCNCDFVCPCLTSNLAQKPSKGYCDAALVYHIEHGHFGNVSLVGLSFAVIIHAPGVMMEGNMSVGVITDERASAEQRDALVAIASGQAGGPMAGLAPLVSTFLGAESGSFHYQINGLSQAVSITGMVDQAIEAVPNAADPTQPLYIDNTVHPTNARLALANAKHSHITALGQEWHDTSGKNNGHFASFDWRSS